jgi:hypothetical protein
MGIISAITAVFSAIVTGLGAIGITGTAASIVAGVITAGIAVGTARQLGTYLKPNLGALGDPGTRIQLPPGTDNKIPVLYGTAWTSGPIIDVNISNSNDTMHYCIVLSEKTDTGSYTIGDIYWNDAKLVFGTTSADAHKVVSKIDKNSTTDSDWNGKIRMRAYAGGTPSADQIFPTVGLMVNATTMMPHWTTTSAYNMEDLVFLMVEVDYDAENGLQGLGALTIQVKNTLNNPGNVLVDYMTNNRYGAGIQSDDIDLTSITGTGATSMRTISDELVPYTTVGGSSVTRKRYTVDGVLSTFDTIKNNIDRICIASSSFFMFDGKQGKFKVKVNHTEDTSSAFELNDDNIVSGIKVQNTSLFDQFNQIQVEFADTNRRDQSNTVFLETAASNRMANEPDNKLEYRLDMVNNNIQAKALANIDLSQTRNNQILSIGGDHSTLQVDVGDVVKVTNDTYGLTNDEYRVMRIKEKEDQTSVITTEMTMIKYNNNIYGNVSVTETDYNDAANSNVVIGDEPPITIRRTVRVGNLLKNVVQTSTSGSGTGAEFTVFIHPTTRDYEAVYVQPGFNGTGYANADTVFVTGDKLFGRDPENNLSFRVADVDPNGNLSYLLNSTQNVSGTSFLSNGANRGKTISQIDIGDKASGGQLDKNPAANVTQSANSAVLRQILPTETIDLTVTENGAYGLMFDCLPVGQVPTGGFDIGLQMQVDVDFANNQTIFNYVNQGVVFQNLVDPLDSARVNTNFTVTDRMIAADIRVLGYNTMANIGGSPNTVGFTNMELTMLRLNKGQLDDFSFDFDKNEQRR